MRKHCAVFSRGSGLTKFKLLLYGGVETRIVVKCIFTCTGIYWFMTAITMERSLIKKELEFLSLKLYFRNAKT